jgi:hypothetical protein
VVSTPELEALIEEAIAHVNAGDMEQGRVLLERVLEQDPKNDRAWVWLSGCVEDPSEGMQVLEGDLVPASEVPPSLLESRLSAIGMGDDVEARESTPPTPDSDVTSPAAPELTELAEQPTTDEPVEKPRRGRIILLVAVLLLLCLIVCALVGTQVVPVLLETVPSNLL